MRAVLIRKYEERDAPAVRALFVEINRAMAPAHMRPAFERYIEQSLREEIDRIEDYHAEQEGSFWVVEDASTMLGMFGLERAGKHTAELRRMYVAPVARRKGVARLMLMYAERVCRETGCDKLVLSTSELQPAALALYRASGFEPVREEVAQARTNKTVGSGLRRFHFEKHLL